MNVSLLANHCCGCAECEALCPARAIEMRDNGRGFLYPAVDEGKCISCGTCAERCTFNTSLLRTPENQKTYVVKNKDEQIRARSRSGGMFFELAEKVIEQGGVVYGCVLIDCIEARHVRADSKEDILQFHGSKYIQSNISGCFDSIINDLRSGLWVLFSGTACQVSAVLDYCKDADCSKLLLVDIVCHGVPSPLVWKDYLTYISKKKRKKIRYASFRDKENFGWAAHVETFAFEDGSKHSCDFFKSLFYAHLIIRDSCFGCPYKNLQRQGDITLADSWGIAQNEPEFDDDKGVSLVIVNDSKGASYFEMAKHRIDRIDVDVEDYLQPPLRVNWERPEEYEGFWHYYCSHSFDQVVKRYIPKQKRGNCVGRVVRRCKGAVKKVARKLEF